MAELKRTFLKGKMNKDLDERLIPNGEYRDALNIEISSSESSNVGSAQNIKGNKEVSTNLTYRGGESLHSDAITVGSYTDEASRKIYNFIHRATYVNANTATSSGDTFYTGVKSDIIEEFTPSEDGQSGSSKIIISDVYETREVCSPQESINKISGLKTHERNGFNTPKGIRKGMRVQLINSSGVDLWAGSECYVTGVSLDTSINAGYVNINPPALGSSKMTQVLLDLGCTFKFTAPKVLNFRYGSREKDLEISGEPFTYTPNNNIITAINCIDNILYFTDGFTEPKKIIIDNFKDNSNYLGYHSFFRKSYSSTQNIRRYVTEDHITVIKKPPRKAPKVDAKISSRVPSNIYIGGNDTGEQYSSSTNSVIAKYNLETGVATQFSLYDDDSNQVFTNTNPSSFYVKALASNVNWKAGDIIKITDEGGTYPASEIKIIEALQPIGVFKVKMHSVNSSYASAWDEAPFPAASYWNGILLTSKPLYEDKFISFATRYKYINGEYSSISPYSPAVFLPGFYSYNAATGNNEGMESNTHSIAVYDFIEPGISDTVEAVEILLKDNNANNLFVLKEVNRKSGDWSNQYIESGASGFKGVHAIDAEAYGSSVAENQLLRIYDAVPVKAKAQEIVANRLVYGNYSEGYNIDQDSIEARVFVDEVDGDFSELIPTEQSSFASSGIDSGTYATRVFNPSFSNTSAIVEDLNNNFSEGNCLYEPLSGSAAANYQVTGQVQILSNINIDLISPTTGDFNIVEDSAWLAQATGQIETKTILVKIDGDDNEVEYVIGAQLKNIPSSGGNITFDISFDHTIALNNTDSIQLKVEINVPQDIPILYNYYDGSEGETVSGFSTIANGGTTFTYTSTTSFNVFAPTIDIAVLTDRPKPSIKSNRHYELGVVYGDKYGRETSVVTNKSFSVTNQIANANKSTKLAASIVSGVPSWASYYKYYVKEVAPVYDNVVLYTAYPNNTNDEDGAPDENTSHLWLSFNSNDRSKIDIDNYLILKKKHASNDAVLVKEAKWRVLDIVDNGQSTSTSKEETLSDGTKITTITQGMQLGDSENILDGDVDPQELNGRFFVKIKKDDNWDTYLNNDVFPETESIDDNFNNGAVFEVEKLKIKDIGLFYEISDSIPLKLDLTYASHFIKPGAKVSILSSSFVSQPAINTFNDEFLQVVSVEGAKAFGATQLDSINNTDSKCRVYLNTSNSLSGVSLPIEFPTVFKFSYKDGSYVTALGYGTVSGTYISLYPFTHRTLAENWRFTSTVALPWYNCISFGNGVESDTIRDDYNQDMIYQQTTAGKQSGFKASIINTDYRRIQNKTDLIYSQIYNSSSRVDGTNEFILAEKITKRLNPSHGSIQKLFTRNTDLLAFCENKVFKILANKDALYNADGNAQLLSTNRVLGQAIPFAGDYGISKNPESFAVEEYRIYFADKDRGSVLRLSMDGITVISDYGMKNWFNDNLDAVSSVVGSYDGRKGDYNIVVNKVISPEYKKRAYCLTYSENVKGWSSFKSFIYDSGISMVNKYYTFKNGKVYLHHLEDESINRNNFYGVNYTSTITPVFNDFSGSVKHFHVVEYEGTDSAIVQNTDDDVWSNEAARNGWYIESIVTDQQEGKVDEFVEKEGKWFNYIKGNPTVWNNLADGTQASGNLNFSEFNIQGIGSLSADATADDTVAEGYDFIVSLTGMSTSFSAGYALYNASGGLAGTSSSVPSVITMTIEPNAGYAIAANQFSYEFSTEEANVFDSISFANNSVAGEASNTVEVTITLNDAYSLSSDESYSLDVNASTITPYGVVYQGAIVFNGNFSPVGGTAFYNLNITANEYLTATLLSTTSSARTYYLDGVIPFTELAQSLVQASLNVNNGLIIGENNISLEVEASEQEFYTIDILNQTQNSYDINVDYIPPASGSTLVDNNNVIVFDLAELEAFITQFASSSEAMTTSNNAHTLSIPVITNEGEPSVTIIDVDTDELPTWIDSYSVVLAAPEADYDYKVNIVFQSNNFEESEDRTLKVRLFGATNSGLIANDFIDVTQSQGLFINAEVTTVGYFVGGAQAPDTAFFANYFDNLNGEAGQGNILPDNDVSYLVVRVFQSTNSLVSPSYSFSPSPTDDWIVQVGYASTETTYDGVEYYQYLFKVFENEGTSQREINLVFTNGDDSTVSDTINIKQEAAYDPEVNTLTMWHSPIFTVGHGGITTVNSAINADDNSVLSVDSSAQSVKVLASAPSQDYIATEPNGGVTIFPNSWDFDYEQILDDLGNELGEAEFLFQYWIENQSIGWSGYPGYDVLYSFNTQENSQKYAINDSGYGTSQYKKRSFDLYGKNPQNTTNTPDKTITVVQQAPNFLALPSLSDNGGTPETSLQVINSSESVFEIPYTTNNTENINYVVSFYTSEGSAGANSEPTWLQNVEIIDNGTNDFGNYMRTLKITLDNNETLGDRTIKFNLGHSTQDFDSLYYSNFGDVGEDDFNYVGSPTKRAFKIIQQSILSGQTDYLNVYHAFGGNLPTEQLLNEGDPYLLSVEGVGFNTDDLNYGIFISTLTSSGAEVQLTGFQVYIVATATNLYFDSPTDYEYVSSYSLAPSQQFNNLLYFNVSLEGNTTGGDINYIFTYTSSVNPDVTRQIVIIQTSS